MEPLSSVDVQAALDALNLDIEVKFFDTSTATAQEAADAIGTEVGSIVKSIVFMVNGEQPVVILTAGDQKVDDRKIAKLYEVGRKKVRIATADQCVQYIGFLPGGVAPVGHRTQVPMWVDANLTRYAVVYAAAGTPNSIFPIPLETLIEVTGSQVADVAI